MPGTNDTPLTPTLRKQNGNLTKVITQPKNTIFSDDMEYRYFQLFCRVSTAQFAGCFDCPVWSHLILQASEHEKTLRRAMIAIGALYATLDKNELSRTPPKTAFDQHHLFAIRTYGRTVNQIRVAITENAYDLRSTVFSCLLMVCFESLHGNFNAAVTQMESGLRLLDQWTKNKTKGDRSSSKSHKSNIAVRRYSRDDIEVELVWMFENLNLQTTRFMEISRVRYPELKKIRLPDMSIDGKRFISMKDARATLSSIRSRVLDFTSSSPFLPPDFSLATPENDTPGEDGRSKDAESIKMDCEEALLRWHNSASLLMKHDLESRDKKSYLGAVSLQVNWIILKIILDCSLNDEMSYDSHLDEFAEILRLTKILLANFSPQTWFSCDLAHVHALYFTRMKCRDFGIRKEAICLSLENMRKSDPEGSWKNSITGVILALVLRTEEEGRVDGMVPLGKRVTVVNTRLDKETESGTIEFLMGDGRVMMRQVLARTKGVLEPCVLIE